MKVHDKKALTIYLASRFFKHLLYGDARKDVIQIADAADYLFLQSDIKSVSNAIQRELYRLARDHGWYKDRNDKWRWKQREEEHCSEVQ